MSGGGRFVDHRWVNVVELVHHGGCCCCVVGMYVYIELHCSALANKIHHVDPRQPRHNDHISVIIDRFSNAHPYCELLRCEMKVVVQLQQVHNVFKMILNTVFST